MATAKRVKTETFTYKMTLDKLKIFIDKIEDLTKLDIGIALIFDKKELLLFSVVGKNLDNVHAFKSHTLETKDIFLPSKIEIENPIRLILSDGKRFVNSIKMFHKYMDSNNINDDVQLTLHYNEMFCERITIKNSKSKEDHPGATPNNHTHNIDNDDIESVMDIDNSNYSFKLKKDDFDYIKSKILIDRVNDIIYLNVTEKSLTLGENRWEHKICEVDFEDTIVTFPKKYFKCINFDKETEMTIYVTDMYLIILGLTTNLLISVDLTV
jgi:hypothetical protein